jgi:hypothetical protein
MTTSLRQIRSAQGPLLFLLLAVFAHLSLGVVSATHHARMLGADGSGVICTLQGVKRIALPPELLAAAGLDQPAPTVQVNDCPLCAAASSAWAPPVAAGDLDFPAPALGHIAVAPPAALSLRSAVFLPPSRAPPVLI